MPSQKWLDYSGWSAQPFQKSLVVAFIHHFEALMHTQIGYQAHPYGKLE